MNAVAPGMVMTDMVRALPEEVLIAAVGEAVLLSLPIRRTSAIPCCSCYRMLPALLRVRCCASTQVIYLKLRK